MLPYIYVSDPIIKGVPLHPFGILVATGVIIGTNITVWRARKRGIDLVLLNSFITWMLVAGFAGGHILDQIFYHPREVLRRPISLVLLWEGLSSFGGFVGALLGILAWRYYRIIPEETADDPRGNTWWKIAGAVGLVIAGLTWFVLIPAWRPAPDALGGTRGQVALPAVLAALLTRGVLASGPLYKASARFRAIVKGSLVWGIGGAVTFAALGVALWKGNREIILEPGIAMSAGQQHMVRFNDDAIRVFLFSKGVPELASIALSFAVLGIILGIAVGTFRSGTERRAEALPMMPFMDLILSVFPIAWIFGRSGCSTVHDHPGMITTGDSFFAVGFPSGVQKELTGVHLLYGDIHRYDLGLLELMFTIVLSAFFVATWKKKLPTGSYVVAVCFAYGPVRFAMDFLRVMPTEMGHSESADPRYGALTPAQWCCVAVIAAGVAVVLRIRANSARGIDPMDRLLLPTNAQVAAPVPLSST